MKTSFSGLRNLITPLAACQAVLSRLGGNTRGILPIFEKFPQKNRFFCFLGVFRSKDSPYHLIPTKRNARFEGGFKDRMFVPL
jgi:hypothetical protein